MPANTFGIVGVNTNMPPGKLLVLGGTGVLGSAVCRRAVNRGLPVVSLTRRGRPSRLRGDWIDHVDWRTGDVLHGSETLRALVQVLRI